MHQTQPHEPAGSHGVSRAEQALAVGQLTIRCTRRGAMHIIAVGGELDVATAPRVEHELRAAERSDAEQILLDLSELTFMCSTGLQMILLAYARSKADRNRLRLRGAPPNVQRIFEITDTTGRLPFTDR